MPLQTETYKQGIKTLLENLFNGQLDPAAAREQFAEGLSTLTETFVKSGTVNVNVSTTGTATAQTGTGVGNVT